MKLLFKGAGGGEGNVGGYLREDGGCVEGGESSWGDSRWCEQGVGRGVLSEVRQEQTESWGSHIEFVKWFYFLCIKNI